jgi:3-methylcrotonyl-CoA carboxylase alpha subunit
MEMNTRLQVEHPVTELVMGVDLVKAQIITAMGQSLGWPAERQARGHAIECRLYAEDPYKGGIPSTGILNGIRFPSGPGRRLEIGFESGDEITSFYDPMIAKVIVWDETRPRAIKKMIRTLKDTVVFGVKTNIPLLIEMLSHVEFVEGRMTTHFVESHFAQGLKAKTPSTTQSELAEELYRTVTSSSMGATTSAGETQGPSPWSFGWRP